MTGDGAALAARVHATRTPSLEEKYNQTLNKLIDAVGDRNDYRNRALNMELTIRCVEKLALAWEQRARDGMPDPTWQMVAADLLAALTDGI